MEKITPFLWFDHQAEEAANFYTGIFADSKILDIARYGETGPGPAGSVMTVRFMTICFSERLYILPKESCHEIRG
jgi:predicted 3-demethylubiquinone-9 3-methyltransferase (glyoxalase superfamily)